jgi:hypothetical protein
MKNQKPLKIGSREVFQNASYFTWFYIRNIQCKKKTPMQKHSSTHVRKKTQNGKKRT